LADPSEEEERATSNFTIILDHELQICGNFKCGGTGITLETIRKAIEISKRELTNL
jgi:exosome complex RNA-binding protein Rrp42 (RNase PH superfamily)